MKIKERSSGSKQKVVCPHKCPLQCTVNVVGIVEEIPEYAATTYSTIILQIFCIMWKSTFSVCFKTSS